LGFSSPVASPTISAARALRSRGAYVSGQAWARYAALLLLVSAPLFAASGCSSRHESRIVRIGAEANGKTVTLQVGDHLQVLLPNPQGWFISFPRTDAL